MEFSLDLFPVGLMQQIIVIPCRANIMHLSKKLHEEVSISIYEVSASMAGCSNHHIRQIRFEQPHDIWRRSLVD